MRLWFLLFCGCSASSGTPDLRDPIDFAEVADSAVDSATDANPTADSATDGADLAQPTLFTASAVASALTVVAGAKVSYAVTVTRLGGFADVIQVSLEGLPSSVTTPSTTLPLLADATTASFELSADVAAGASSSNVTVRISGGGQERLLALSLTVEEPAGFAITVDPLLLQFAGGNTLDLTVDLGRAGGFSDAVTVTFPDLPSSLHATSATFSGSQLVFAIGSDETFTLTSGSFTVHAEGGGIVREVTVQYINNASVDYSLSTDPPSLSVSRTTTGVIAVKVNRVNGYNGDVSVTAMGLPAGVTVTPSPLVIAGALSQGTLEVHVDNAAALGGPTNLTLEGASSPNGHPTTRSTSVALTVAAAPGFSLAVSPSPLAVAQGASANLALSIVRDGGFTDALTSQLLTPPAGVTASGGAFATNAVASSLTVAAAADALLLVPTTSTVSTGSAAGSQTGSLVVTVTPGADPHLDPSYGTGGANVYTTLPFYGGVLAADVGPSGAALIVTQQEVVRLLPTGAIDASFGTAGSVGNPSPVWAEVATIGPGGDAYMAARSGETAYVTKIKVDGSLDPAFGGGTGWVTFPFSGSASVINGLKVRNDGAIFVYGSTRVGATDDFEIAKLTSAGALDTGFGGDGLVEVDFGASEQIRGLVFAGNKLILSGESQGRAAAAIPLALARLTASGALDTTFDGDGLLLVQHDLQQYAYVTLELASGKLLIAGPAQPSTGASYLQLTRLSTTGVLDTTFDGDGFATLPSLTNFTLMDLAEDASGRILLAGASSTGAYTLARLTSGGALDASFSGDGIDQLIGGSGGFEMARVVKVDPSTGAYFTFGQLGPRVADARFLP